MAIFLRRFSLLIFRAYLFSSEGERGRYDMMVGLNINTITFIPFDRPDSATPLPRALSGLFHQKRNLFLKIN